MSGYLQTIKKESSLYTKTIIDDIRNSRDKDFFHPTGVQVYVGLQGQGKTVSAVHHALMLKQRYPRAILVTNLYLTGMRGIVFSGREQLPSVVRNINPHEEYIRFSSMDELESVLQGVNNGKYGVLYLIDEIHTYFNALDSKNIPPYVFAEIAQQRKQRKCIVATSQLFPRIAKPFREQVDNVIACRTFLGVFTMQTAYDGSTLDQDYSGKYVHSGVKKRGWFIQTRRDREAYDTFQVIKPGEVSYATEKPMQLVQNKKSLVPFKK